jgi:2-amino-4-hydroxy-6-hydroxymethyldihydropteridine diphosphokinase
MKSESLDQAVIVALGSNLRGDYPSLPALLEEALGQFAAEGLRITTRSSWWRSAAWPDPSAPAYLNGAVLVETDLGPLATLEALRRIEARFGRVRERPNQPRTLDLDLIAHGRTVMSEPDLALPHPRAADRRFVMGPISEIAPGWRHPLSGATAARLLAFADVGADAQPIKGPE